MPATDFDFGAEFINLASSRQRQQDRLLTVDTLLMDGRPFTWRERTSVAQSNGNTLQRLANELFAAGGGYLYVPPGRYLVGRSVARPVPEVDAGEFADIVIPENVTLWFAPGATLIPIAYDPGASPREIPGLPMGGPESHKTRIEIRGDILADIRQIFDVLVPDATMPNGRPAGRILLTSQRIREVYPEWWGALPSDPGNVGEPAGLAIRRTTLAIQAAMEAAYTWRTTPARNPDGTLRLDRAWNRRAVIPVVAMGIYVVHRPIRVFGPLDASMWASAGMPAIDPGGFTLIGERAPATTGVGTPTFQASAHFDGSTRFAGDAMLWFDGVIGFAVRGVVFNGLHIARRCVKVEPTEARFSYAEFDSCSFLNSAGIGVSLDVQRVPAASPVRDYWNVLFNRCRFDQGTVESVSRVILAGGPIDDIEGNLVSVELRLDDNEGVEFRTSTFTGHASPAIRAYSGRFAVNEAVFHVLRAAQPRLSQLQGTANPRLSPNFRHGTDIFLERDDRSSSARLGRIIPPAFTARELESQSWQFLATRGTILDGDPVPRQGNRSSVILLNAHHSPVGNHDDVEENRADQAPAPPAVFWGDPGLQGSHLIMIGCQFTGQYIKRGVLDINRVPRDHAVRSLVYVTAGAQGGDIYNVGSHTIAAFTDNPAPPDPTPNTANFLIRVYNPGEWHRPPDRLLIEGRPVIDVTRIRQLMSFRAVMR